MRTNSDDDRFKFEVEFMGKDVELKDTDSFLDGHRGKVVGTVTNEMGTMYHVKIPWAYLHPSHKSNIFTVPAACLVFVYEFNFDNEKIEADMHVFDVLYGKGKYAKI